MIYTNNVKYRTELTLLRNKLETVIGCSEQISLGEFQDTSSNLLDELHKKAADSPAHCEVGIGFILFQARFPFYRETQTHTPVDPTMLYKSKEGVMPEFWSRGVRMRGKLLPLLGIETMNGKNNRLIGYRFNNNPTNIRENTLFVPEGLKPQLHIRHHLLSSVVDER